MKKILIVLSLLISSIAYAEHGVDEKHYDLYWQQIPAVCGTSEATQEYIDDKGFDVKHISLGRSGSRPDGEPVYMITYYEKNDEVIVTVDIPSAGETCILFHTYNKTDVQGKTKKGV
jgi:hypothetical protein